MIAEALVIFQAFLGVNESSILALSAAVATGFSGSSGLVVYEHVSTRPQGSRSPVAVTNSIKSAVTSVNDKIDQSEKNVENSLEGFGKGVDAKIEQKKRIERIC